MERLPYIDEHSRSIRAPRERAWAALIAIGAELGVVAPGEAGEARRGFAVEEAHPPSRLALAGSHRFSRYSLVFELEEARSDRTLIRARTHAAFPGVLGRAYRALVIGSGGHRVVVASLLRKIEARACSA